MIAADAAFKRYAEEWRRRARIERDPLATEWQRAQQRRTTEQAYAGFWQAFTGQPIRTGKLSIATVDGRAVDA